MRKIPKFLLTALMAVITCLSASAFTVVVDHPEALKGMFANTGATVTFVQGANVIDANASTGSLLVQQVDPWVIDSAKDSSGADIYYNTMGFLKGYLINYTSPSSEVFTFTTHNPEAEVDPPTPSSYLTLNVDHPEALTLKVIYDGESATTVSLEEGANQIATDKGGQLRIDPVGDWQIESAEGLIAFGVARVLQFSAGHTGTYTIVTKEPEPDPTYFTLNIDHPEAITAQVSYNGQAAQTLTLVEGANQVESTQAGLISITANDPWEIETADGFLKNPFTGGYSKDFEAGFEGTYTITTKEPEPDPTYFTLNIDHPEAITAQVSYNGQAAQTLTLVAGANQVESTQAGLISITANDPWEIETADGFLKNPFTGGYSKDFEAGFEGSYTITTKDTTPQGITLVVDNPDAVTVEVGGMYGGVDPRKVDLVEGNNLIELPTSYSYIQINNVDPYLITSIVKNGSYNETVSQGKSCRLTFWDQSIVATYEITTKNMDEARTASFTLIADDPSLFTAKLTGTYTTLELVEGENTVKYDPEVETGLEISAKNSSTKPIYKVTLDGEEVTKGYSSYNVTLSQDCVVEVTAIIPPVPVTVTFKYANDDSFGSITSVEVDGEVVEDFDGYTVNMKAGQQITIKGSSMYKYNSFLVDGTSPYFASTNPYKGLVLKDIDVEVDARKYASFNITVKVTDPAHLKLFRGYSYNNDRIELTSTENTVEVFENNTTISWEKAPGCEIVGVKIDGEPYTGYYANTKVQEGTVLEFETKAIELDKTAVLWIDDLSASTGLYFSTKENVELFTYSTAGGTVSSNVENGYNQFDFYDGWNKFELLFYGSNIVNKVYLNGELVDPTYTGGTSRKLTLDDNAVIKVFFAEEPVECNVTFDIADDVDDFIVTRDILLTEEDMDYIREGYSCFKGTQFEIAKNSTDIEVEVNGVKLGADAERSLDNYRFVVTDPETVVKVTKNQGNGVSLIEGEVVEAPVFNLQGIKVADSTRDLAPGLYIVAGKKVLVK